MVSIAILLLFMAGVLIAMITGQSSVQRAFALVSIFPIILFVGSFLGLVRDGNSMVFFVGFVLSLLLSILVMAFGLGLIVFQMKNRARVWRQVLLTLLASCPIAYAVLKRWF